MNEVIKEIREVIGSFIKHKIFGSRKIMISSGVIFLLIIGGMIIYQLIQPKVAIGEVGNQEVWSEYDQYVQEMYEQKLADNFFEQDGKESVEDGENSSSSMDATLIETTINSFFLYANEGNTDLFISAISPERINLDFSQKDLSERIASFQKAMDGISQNGTLEKVTIEKAKRLIGGTSRIVLNLKYQNIDYPIRVNLEIIYIKATTFNDVLSEKYDIPMIQSSVWTLIKQIEQQINERR